MSGAKVFHARITTAWRRCTALVPAAECRVHDHDERVVVREQNGILLAEAQLDLLRNLASCVPPVYVSFEVALYASEGPADGVVVAEVSEPSVEGFGRA